MQDDKINTDVTAPDSNVVVAPTPVPVAPENPERPPVYKNPCEQGLAGYVMYDNKCITQDAFDKIRRAELERQQADLSREIKNIADELSDLNDSFKSTVWKNKDGKFNTARLVSDSVAAVVLGTTGGLITSSVIKKNNLNKGFENIRCVIGGQDVAGWGDEFRVGIK